MATLREILPYEIPLAFIHDKYRVALDTLVIHGERDPVPVSGLRSVWSII